MTTHGLRYDRCLSPSFVEALTGGADSLGFLIKDAARFSDDPNSLDIQIRSGNKLMLYHGGTRILVVSYKASREGLPLSFDGTDKFYQALTEYKELLDSSRDGNLAEFRKKYSVYMRRAVESIDSAQPRYYAKKIEGYWQNRISLDYGIRWRSSDRWLIVDREVVAGFENAPQKKEALERITKPFHESVLELRREDPKKWGRPEREKAFGDELDMVAVDSDGNIVCIELKHGGNTSGIYWGMYQVSVYHQLTSRDQQAFVCGVKDLLTQKIRLGLLPESAQERARKIGSNSVSKVVLAIAEPKYRSSCWEKLAIAIERGPQYELPKEVALFSFPDNGDERVDVQVTEIDAIMNRGRNG